MLPLIMLRRQMLRPRIWLTRMPTRRRLPPPMPMPLQPRRPLLTLRLPLPPLRRAAAALPIGSTVPYLPPNCTSSVINGTNYFNCNGVYYKAGFQGNNVVYIVSTP